MHHEAGAVNFDTTFVIGHNVKSVVTGGAAGRSLVTCNGQPPSSGSLAAVATSNVIGLGQARIVNAYATVIGTDATAEVWGYDAAGSLATTSYTVTIYGE
jgi:hypothetical protein